jgi:hypothetical protein
MFRKWATTKCSSHRLDGAEVKHWIKNKAEPPWVAGTVLVVEARLQWASVISEEWILFI